MYDARNAEGEEVAIKIVDRQRAHNQHFQRELDIAFNMEHPNVIELAQVRLGGRRPPFSPLACPLDTRGAPSPHLKAVPGTGAGDLPASSG